MDGPSDIGWKQFSISIIDLLRWPAAFIAVAVILRLPLERLIGAITGAIQG